MLIEMLNRKHLNRHFNFFFMKVISIKIIISVYTLFLNISCTDLKKPAIIKKPFKQEIVKIIPKNKYGGEYYPYKVIQNDTKRVGLNFLDNGYDSMFIRLWYVYNSTMQVTDLKISNGNWSGEVHNMNLGFIDYKTEVTNINTTKVFPKSPWNIFIGKLFSLDILDMPDDSELSDYHSSTDASFVIVEIATKERYKIYSYSEPYMHLEFPSATKMENILKLIEEELGVKRHGKL